MATYFPQVLVNKVMTQLPYSTQQSYETVVVDMESGPRHVYGRFGTGLDNFPEGPLWRFDHQLNLTDSELIALKEFFADRKGKLEEFIYLDPSGNLVKYSEDYDQSDWQKTNITVGDIAEDPFGGTRATTLTSTGSDGRLSCVVLPDGDADDAGIMITGSVYARAYETGRSLSVAITDASSTILASNTIALKAVWQWYRVSVSYEVADPSAIRFMIGGNSNWSSFALDVFGAQCVSMPAQGGYVKSPEFWAYHPKCRFDQDMIVSRRIGPNQNQLSLAIKEIF